MPRFPTSYEVTHRAHPDWWSTHSIYTTYTDIITNDSDYYSTYNNHGLKLIINNEFVRIHPNQACWNLKNMSNLGLGRGGEMSYEMSHLTSVLHSRLTSRSDSVRTSDFLGLNVDGMCILLTEIIGYVLHTSTPKNFHMHGDKSKYLSMAVLAPLSQESRCFEDWQLTSRIKCHPDRNYFP